MEDRHFNYHKVKKKYLKFLTSQEVMSEPFRDKLGQLNNFYLPISKMIAEDYLKKKKIRYEILTVPGSMEIPLFLKKNIDKFLGYIILGCVIKGETDHYHVVKDITLSKIYDFSYENNFPISNALLTVENYSQALERSKVDKKNLGENAAKVCLELIKKINEK